MNATPVWSDERSKLIDAVRAEFDRVDERDEEVVDFLIMLSRRNRNKAVADALDAEAKSLLGMAGTVSKHVLARDLRHRAAKLRAVKVRRGGPC